MLKITESPINWKYININEIAFCQSYISMNRELLRTLVHYINTTLLSEFNAEEQKKEYNKILIEHPLTDIDWWKGFYPQVEIYTKIILKSGYELKLDESTSTEVIKALEKVVDCVNE